jgi:hypothetical protein
MVKNTKLFAVGFIFTLALTLQSGCAKPGMVTNQATKPENSMVAQPATKPATIPQNATVQPPAQKPANLTGKVVETMDASGYTYVNLEKDGKTTWVALPVTKVKVGEEIEVRPGMQMGKFTSKTLNRTFDEIIFSSGVVTGAKPQLPPGHQPIDAMTQVEQEPSTMVASPQQKAHGTMAQTGQGMTSISGKVLETMDSGGYTYVNLESDGKKVWAAIPVTPVKVGQQLTLLPGMKMDNFTSKSLNRTFDSVIFSGGILPATK